MEARAIVAKLPAVTGMITTSEAYHPILARLIAGEQTQQTQAWRKTVSYR
jgi:hypothetical protein